MLKSVSLDLPIRLEKRYIVPSSTIFLEKMKLWLKETRFSKNPFVQTIYFNNEDGEVPFDYSLKARKYLPRAQTGLVLDDSQCFLDFKLGSGEFKEKIRFESNLEDSIDIIQEKFCFDSPLMPVTAVTYHRRHFAPKEGNGARLTVDSDMNYFYFHSKKTALPIGEERYCRVELKQKERNPFFENILKNVLTDLDAFPIISKKFMSYSFLHHYRTNTFGGIIHKELKNLEIESKLESQSDLFAKIKGFFKENRNGFVLNPKYPYTEQTASVNRYCKNGEDSFKVLLRGNSARIVRKEKVEIVPDRFGLNCILKRAEVKEPRIPIWSNVLTQATVLGELHRKRKAIWVEKPETKRIYHISLDLCEDNQRRLHQVEVEYTGCYVKQNVANEGEIIQDISIITKLLLGRFPELKTSTLTKQKWVNAER